MLLALDTSTSLASFALMADGQLLAETTWRAGRAHSAQLMVQIDQTLTRLGRRPADLQAVAAARGPGSFTGVRVGVALVKGLALALGVPAFGVDSLEVLAAAQEWADRPVRPLLEIGRGRFATALYQRGPAGWARRGSIQGIRLEELADLVAQPTILCGDLAEVDRQLIASQLGALAQLASPAASLRRAGYLAQLAWQRWQAGQRPAPDALEPIYLGGQLASAGG